MKKGLIMEGGGMRGMFTAGILDVFMENGIRFDGAVGVSAGALFGCNLKSHQPGRAIRYNQRFCQDPRYGSVASLLKTGDLYDPEFCYHEIPGKLDYFAKEAFKNDPMEFWVVATDAETGKAVYYRCSDGGERDIQWMRASAAMPLFATVVKSGKYKLMDGCIADSVPVRFFESKGYDRNVVILTRPYGYRKKFNKLLPAVMLRLAKYPKLIGAISARHLRYNKTMEYIEAGEETGRLFVIRPEEALPLGNAERDPEKLGEAYRLGREAGEKKLASLKEYLGLE